MTIILAKLAAFFAGPIGRWIVVAALISAALFAGGVYERDIGYREGLDVGAKQLEAQAKANASAVIALNAKNRKQEQDQQKDLAQDGAEYQKQIDIAHQIRDRDVAAARAGAIKLWIATHPGSSGDGSAPKASTAPGVGDGETRAELPPAVTSDLLALADDADAVVRQLTACQTIVETYQK